MSNEEERAYLEANGWCLHWSPADEWLHSRHSVYNMAMGDAVAFQRAYDKGRADALAEVMKPAPVEAEKDEAMSKTSALFTIDTTGLSSERVLRLPNSDYGIKLNVKHGEPSVMLEIGNRVVNRYDTVIEALSRAYIGFDVEHLIEEKYSVTPRDPEPVESDEEFILRHQWRGGSVPPYWVHDDVRDADGNHVSFLHPRSVAALQRAINRAIEKAVTEARNHNA